MKDIELINGMKIPCIGYGTFPSTDKLVINIPIAYKAGFRMLDTSKGYHNMTYIGQVRRESPQVKEMLICTKISFPSRIFKIKRDFIKWKQELGLTDEEPVDILLMHFPYPSLYIDIWRIMEELYEAGQCRAIGVCNFEVKHLKNLMQHCKIKPMINQYELHPMFRQVELSEYCKQHEIQIMSYSPVARMDSRLIKHDELVKIAKRYSKTVPQIIFRWNIQHEYIPIPAASKEEHIYENIDIFDFNLSDDEMMTIDSLEAGMRIRYDPNKIYGLKTKLKYFILHVVFSMIKMLKKLCYKRC